MPTYDYRCSDCGDFSVLRRLAERNEPCACPGCGKASPRQIHSMPMLGGSASGSRGRSAADSGIGSSSSSAQHGGACGCCAPGKSSKSGLQPGGGGRGFLGGRGRWPGAR
ncbi:MAG: zinc ribbon domain-containing protein [Burkholderiaceae bacterium]